MRRILPYLPQALAGELVYPEVSGGECRPVEPFHYRDPGCRIPGDPGVQQTFPPVIEDPDQSPVRDAPLPRVLRMDHDGGLSRALSERVDFIEGYVWRRSFRRENPTVCPGYIPCPPAVLPRAHASSPAEGGVGSRQEAAGIRAVMGAYDWKSLLHDRPVPSSTPLTLFGGDGSIRQV